MTFSIDSSTPLRCARNDSGVYCARNDFSIIANYFGGFLGGLGKGIGAVRFGPVMVVL